MFVENFSNNQREEFFEKELPFLCTEFEKVIVIPLYENNNVLNYENAKIEIKQFNAFEGGNRLKIGVANFFLIVRVYLYELVKTHHKWYYIKNCPKLINQLIQRIAAAKKLESIIHTDILNATFYSYWFNQWVLILSVIKAYNPQLTIITRAHGSDYKEEQVQAVLPFRYFQLKVIDKIVTVSQYAKNYLQTTFGVDENKIFVNRLGLTDSVSISPVDSGILHLVSCSSLIPLKRVHLIPEILKKINVPVLWHHFGSGPLLDKVEAQCKLLPAHITPVLMGYVKNEEVLHYLKSNRISFFINVSEYEGIPVTLMEAARFGIPLIGVNVGGVSEIVGNETGRLFDADFIPEDLASYIVAQHQSGVIYSEQYRQRVKAFSKRYYSAEANYTELARNLLKKKRV